MISCLSKDKHTFGYLWKEYHTTTRRGLRYKINPHGCDFLPIFLITQMTTRSWSYGSWIYNYLCTQCLSPLMFWLRMSVRARCTTLSDTVCQWLSPGRRFSPRTPVSSTNKTDRHDIGEILLKVVLNSIKQTNKHQTDDYDIILVVH